MTIAKTRRSAYRLARALGNVQAAEKGPSSYARRVVRRSAYKATNKTLGRSLRRLGL
jgi:hypothetical protein